MVIGPAFTPVPHRHFVRRGVVVAPTPVLVAPAPVVCTVPAPVVVAPPPPAAVVTYPTGQYLLQVRHHRYVWVWVPAAYVPPPYPY